MSPRLRPAPQTAPPQPAAPPAPRSTCRAPSARATARPQTARVHPTGPAGHSTGPPSARPMTARPASVTRAPSVRRESSESALARCPRAAPAPRALQSSKSASSLTRGSGTPGSPGSPELPSVEELKRMIEETKKEVREIRQVESKTRWQIVREERRDKLAQTIATQSELRDWRWKQVEGMKALALQRAQEAKEDSAWTVEKAREASQQEQALVREKVEDVQQLRQETEMETEMYQILDPTERALQEHMDVAHLARQLAAEKERLLENLQFSRSCLQAPLRRRYHIPRTGLAQAVGSPCVGTSCRANARSVRPAASSTKGAHQAQCPSKGSRWTMRGLSAGISWKGGAPMLMLAASATKRPKAPAPAAEPGKAQKDWRRVPVMTGLSAGISWKGGAPMLTLAASATKRLKALDQLRMRTTGQSAGISWKGNALTLKLAALAMMPQDSNHQAVIWGTSRWTAKGRAERLVLVVQADELCTFGDLCRFSHDAPRGPIFNSQGAEKTAVADDRSVCRHFLEGKCTFGDACRFSHALPGAHSSWGFPVDERPVCRHFLEGKCTYGHDCRFSHDAMAGRQEPWRAQPAPMKPLPLPFRIPAGRPKNGFQDSSYGPVRTSPKDRRLPICRHFLLGKPKSQRKLEGWGS
eukprot:g28239.t1